MHSLAIHASCIGLVLLNLLVRSARINLIFRSLDVSVRKRDLVSAVLAGDAAATLTPLRMGGLPAQLGFLQKMGIPANATISMLAIQSILLYSVYALAGLFLAVRAGTEWIKVIADAGDKVRSLVPTVVILLLVGTVLVIILRRFFPGGANKMNRSMRETIQISARMGVVPALLTVPLTLLDIITRLAILPILTIGIADTASTEVLAIASFVMLYGQVFMPTPGGAGLVDIGLLGGMAGNLGASAAAIVFWWRVYTAGIHVALCIPSMWWSFSSRKNIKDS